MFTQSRDSGVKLWGDYPLPQSTLGGFIADNIYFNTLIIHFRFTRFNKTRICVHVRQTV